MSLALRPADEPEEPELVCVADIPRPTEPRPLFSPDEVGVLGAGLALTALSGLSTLLFSELIAPVVSAATAAAIAWWIAHRILKTRALFGATLLALIAGALAVLLAKEIGTSGPSFKGVASTVLVLEVAWRFVSGRKPVRGRVQVRISA